jgi:hypothetical protein
MQLCIASIPDRLNKELTTIISKKFPPQIFLFWQKGEKKALQPKIQTHTRHHQKNEYSGYDRTGTQIKASQKTVIKAE